MRVQKLAQAPSAFAHEQAAVGHDAEEGGGILREKHVLGQVIADRANSCEQNHGNLILQPNFCVVGGQRQASGKLRLLGLAARSPGDAAANPYILSVVRVIVKPN